MTLHEQCLAIYESEGSSDVVGVNHFLRDKYTDATKRVSAMLELEGTGLWEIKWHRSGQVPADEPDDGLVRVYLG